MATNAQNDAPAPDRGLPKTLRQVHIEAHGATVRRAAEDNYRRVAVSAVANEPRDGVSVAAGLVQTGAIVPLAPDWSRRWTGL